MELPNLQVGKTQDRVAAGNTIRITASNGDFIVARAITPIRNSSVAFQKVEGQGWVAFDPSSPALTSSSKEIRRKRPRKSRIISVTEQYFFKGLVRFLDKQLYKGGDNAIVAIDDNIDIFGILGFANLGTDSLDFIAVYRKQNDLRIDLRGNKNIIDTWFLKGYSLFNRWLGTDFYGVNGLSVYRLYNRTRYDNPRSWGYDYTVLPKYGVEDINGFYDESTNIAPVSEPQITATESGAITVTELGETVFPLSGVSASGPERQEGTWTYKDKYHASKRMDKNIIIESAIVSTNFGQLAQGRSKFTENMSVILQEDYLEELTEDIFVVEREQDQYVYYLRSQLIGSLGLEKARNYEFNREISGVRQGTTTLENQWYVYLNKDNIVNCYSRDSATYGGDLNIVNLFRASELDEYSSLERETIPRGSFAVQIFPKGIPFGFFEQTASSSCSRENTSYIVRLMLSGNECYIYSELNYSSSLIADSTHANDTDLQIDGTFAYYPGQEEVYWYDDFDRRIGLSDWFLTGIVQSVNISHPTINRVDTIKLKNNRDDLIIPINPDSIALLIENPSVLVAGQTISVECYLPYTGLDSLGSIYERALEYSVRYSSATPSRESTMSKEITITKSSDDTLHHQIFDNLLEKEYEIIWKEIDGYYIGDAAMLSYQEEDTPYYDYIDNRILNNMVDGTWEYQVGRIKRITGVTIRVNTRRKINASLLERFNLNSYEADLAVIVSRDNYYNYIMATDSFFGSPDTTIVPNLFLRENPIIATHSIALDGEIESDRTMYAEILELLPDGRWVRREEESGDVTAMSLGSPDNTTDLWSYYKE